VEGSEGILARMRKKPFALWVIFGGLVYFGLAILALALPFLVASPASAADPLVASILVFTALFFVSAFLALGGKRWTLALTGAVSILFLALFGPFFVPSLANPADSTFWLAVSGIPALVVVAIFSILSFPNAKTGLLQKSYLATPRSAGGLLTVALIGFVVGSLVVGAIGAGVILRNLEGVAADIEIVPNAPAVELPYSPQTFPVAIGGTVTWVNKDTTAHTVTSNTTGQFDSGLLTTGASWSHTFSQAGTFEYHCTPHPQMWGVIVVG